MFEKDNMCYTPTEDEMKHYIRNHLWEIFSNDMKNTYRIIPKFEFSKCNWEHGWNVKFKKGSRSLCTVYPRENYFTVLVVIGKKEKAPFKAILSTLDTDIQQIYKETPEGNGQKWLMIDLEDHNKRYEDVLRIIEIRSRS